MQVVWLSSDSFKRALRTDEFTFKFWTGRQYNIGDFVILAEMGSENTGKMAVEAVVLDHRTDKLLTRLFGTHTVVFKVLSWIERPRNPKGRPARAR
jgi:hypothetical protein